MAYFPNLSKKVHSFSLLIGLGIALLLGCTKTSIDPLSSPSIDSSPGEQQDSPLSLSGDSSLYADVLSVAPNGESGAYQFAVSIQSPDTGCEQYANWWEVVSEDGALIHRRILFHSHVNEQPFQRSSGPVAIAADQVVIVRAHMHPIGYGGQVLKGSVTQGFLSVESDDDFALDLAQKEPLPTDCTF